jgi:hypothetical protein
VIRKDKEMEWQVQREDEKDQGQDRNEGKKPREGVRRG